jgi:CubicO group peptidase (beta-lactamase class C family)
MDNRFEELTQRASELMERHSIPGMALGMIIDGENHAQGLGMTSIDNPLDVSDRTLFQIGSTTKTVPATALARLADPGHIDLDDKVRTVIPDLELADPHLATSITIRHLLNHTAGFAGDLFSDTGRGDDCVALYVDQIRDLPQLIQPGFVGVYNNAAFVLAGRVIEMVTGDTYEAAAQSLVLDPMGLNDSLFDPAAVMLRRFAVGHTVHPDGRVIVTSPWELPRCVAAAGGLSASVLDQLQYARFHMGDGTAADGTRLLSMSMMTEMQAPTVDFIDNRRFGLSWMVTDLDRDRIVAHGGATNGQMSAFWMCRDKNLAFVSMTNGSTGRHLNQELSAYAHELFLGYKAPSVTPLDIDDPSEFKGRYRSEPNGEIYEMRANDDQLVFQLVDHGRFVAAFDSSVEPIPSTVDFQAIDQVIMNDGDLDGRGGVFMRSETGEVTHLRMDRLLIKQL